MRLPSDTTPVSVASELLPLPEPTRPLGVMLSWMPESTPVLEA